jgi:hypothetical protein
MILYDRHCRLVPWKVVKYSYKDLPTIVDCIRSLLESPVTTAEVPPDKKVRTWTDNL